MKKRACTLMEFLLLICIISLIVALMVPLFVGAQRKELKRQALKAVSTNSQVLTVSNIPPGSTVGTNVLTVTNLAK